MSKRLFLEDVGTPSSTTPIGNTRTWEVRNLRNDSTIPPLMYVVESKMGESLLLGRGISGRLKFNMIRYIATSVAELFFEQLHQKTCVQYLILRGAYPFDLQHAFGHTPPYDRILLPTGFIKLQRVLNQEGTNWEIRAKDFVGTYQGDTWLIPDTAIASGSTIAFFLRNAFSHHLPKQVYIFTACGSLEGIQRIYQECLEKEVELIPVFSQCMFEVSQKGNLPGLPLTDLPVTNSGSITTKQFFEKAYQRYQGTRMCCVGDIGESLDDPIQYSLHTLWEMQVLKMDPKKEDWKAWTVDVREEKFKKKVFDLNPILVDYFNVLWK
ncbi:MAG: hypothetical protein FJ115_11065 [Deltaproteobacteria bacterium]|nr:hypothetical protein [Deltaproteobacteria bacterium]MBM4324090.1 hypothetical protein [Deltaproteobacteria bacterium]